MTELTCCHIVTQLSEFHQNSSPSSKLKCGPTTTRHSGVIQPNSIHSDEQIFTFTGEEHKIVIPTCQVATGSRAKLSVFKKYPQFVTSARLHKKTIEMNEYHGVAFVMSDWTILSIFIIWATLLFVTLLVRLIEIAKQVNWKGLLYSSIRDTIAWCLASKLYRGSPIGPQFHIENNSRFWHQRFQRRALATL